MLRRIEGPGIDPIVINVLDEILITEVTSRPLSLEEIRDRGIVITEDNFQVLEFTAGFLIESEPVSITFPVVVPNAQPVQQIDVPKLPSAQRLEPPSVNIQIPQLDIPNLMVKGFEMLPLLPLEGSDKEKLPEVKIPGLILIPGDVGFLNEFFSVLLMVTNAAPEGSALVVRNLRAEIKLPPGSDGLFGTGDDPLRVAETQEGGVQSMLPIFRAVETATGEKIVNEGEDFIRGSETGQAEFLVEGRKEGTHTFDIEVMGDLEGFQSGNTYPVTTTVPGTVLVRNPNFSITLAHPEIVRDQEPCSLFITLTNTSDSPANLLSLRLNARSLSGTRPADGQEDVQRLETLAPRDSHTFEFRMVSQQTGKVSATVLLADDGLNGQFLLTTGVSEEGVPLSPNTLVLPQLANLLPPELAQPTMRLLGQAWSVATAPAGSLPPGIDRMSKVVVGYRSTDLAEAGLRVKFRDVLTRVVPDLLLDLLGADVLDTEALPDREREIRAFDTLRRRTNAGLGWSQAFAEYLSAEFHATDLLAFQQNMAKIVRYRAPPVRRSKHEFAFHAGRSSHYRCLWPASRYDEWWEGTTARCSLRGNLDDGIGCRH